MDVDDLLLASRRRGRSVTRVEGQLVEDGSKKRRNSSLVHGKDDDRMASTREMVSVTYTITVERLEETAADIFNQIITNNYQSTTTINQQQLSISIKNNYQSTTTKYNN